MPGCGALLPMSLATSTRSTNIHRLANTRPCQPIGCVFPAQERGRTHAGGTHAAIEVCERLDHYCPGAWSRSNLPQGARLDVRIA